MQEQIYFTKEITSSGYRYNPNQRWISPKKFKIHDPNEDIQNERYCPRCDNKHKDDCELVQMIVEFNTYNIQNDTICLITFIDNIKIPLWSRNVEKELGCKLYNNTYYMSISQEDKEKFYDQQVIPIETSLYKYNDNVVMTNFNIKLFADSFADDELESFRCNVNKFTKNFDKIKIDDHLTEIKYILLTEYKNSYIQKQDFLDKHKPNLYTTTIEFTINNMNKVIVYNGLSSKSNYIPNAIITKLITLYLDFQINPLFDAIIFCDKKPNPHVSRKKKSHKQLLS